MGIHTSEAKIESAGQGKFQDYMFSRGRYLELCWKYRLEPRDLGIGDLLEIDFAKREDKLLLAKLIVKLCNLERELRDILEDPLFPETVTEVERSGILRPVKH